MTPCPCNSNRATQMRLKLQKTSMVDALRKGKTGEFMNTTAEGRNGQNYSLRCSLRLFDLNKNPRPRWPQPQRQQFEKRLPF